uniref:transmembrane protein 168-like n=1 Tax=Styela clava TaxID=7725 RepID=UPI00193A1A16|nr:transmembrane protein 168-like [Styela clava]
MEKHGKPFRSRSFSFGSLRTKRPGSIERNQLLDVVTSVPFNNMDARDTSAPRRKNSFCERWNKTMPYHEIKAYNKHIEMKQTYLPGRSVCRYICNILRFVATILISVAFALHLQYHWQMGNYAVEIIVVSTTGITSFTFVVILYIFFGLKAFSRSIVHFWISLMYGILFIQQTHLKLLNKAILICVLFSTAIRCFCSLAERVFKLTMHRSQFLSKTELCDLVAFGSTCFLLPPQKCLDLILEIGTLGFIVMHLRMKSPLCIVTVLIYGIVTGISVLGNLGVITNKYAFICFVVRMLWDPMLDLFFSKLQPLTRWKCFFNIRRVWICLFFFFLLIVEIVFLLVALQAITMHAKYEWPVFLPFVVISTLSWLAMHSTYFTMQVPFLNRVSRCQRLLENSKFEEKTLYQVLSSQGVKFLCGTCHGVTSGCVFGTGILGTVCWRRNDGTYPALFLFLLTIESLSLALFAHLATYLRGTSYGYGIVASSDNHSRNKLSLTLPSSSTEVQTMSASRMMNAIQHFFRDQLIDSLGCDCWSRGAKLTLSSVETKLALLFSKRTSRDEVPYDNYVIYFNGIADENGSWILADGGRLSLDRLLQIWNDRPGADSLERKSSRMILISDASNSKAWIDSIKRSKVSIVFQCSTYACDEGFKTNMISEEAWAKRGDFTLLWTAFLKSLQNLKNEESHETLTQNFIREVEGQGIRIRYTLSKDYITSTLSPPSGNFSSHGCLLCCLPTVLFTSFVSKHLFWFMGFGPLKLLCFHINNQCFRQKMHDVGQFLILINSK